MKRNTKNIILIIAVILIILAVAAFYLYDVIWLKTPFTYNLFRSLSVILLLSGTLIRLINGGGRKSLDIYEKAYAEELGVAFQNKPFQRKKLLCACRLYAEDNNRKALKYLFQLLKEAEFERDAEPVLFFIAMCFSDAGVREEAIKTYYELLKINPNNARVHSNLGLLLIAEGDFDTALKHYDKSIELLPENYYAYVNRANYYFRVNKYDEAVSDAEQALKYKNNGMEAASLLTIIFALKGNEEKKKHYYHISITSGKNPKDLNEAIEYFMNEQTEEATEES